MNLVFDKYKNRVWYARSFSQSRAQLHTKLLQYYGCAKKKYSVEIFPSGMTAISVIMTILLDKDSICVMGDELYCDTFETIEYLTKKYGAVSHFVDTTDNLAIINYFSENGKNISLFFIESCSNPSGQVFDFSIIPELKKYAPNCVFCVDNTWVSGCSFIPFSLGIDVVIESMTKYISTGSCIGGMMIGKKDIMKQVRTWIEIYGQFIGADHCDLFLEKITDIESRINQISNMTLELAQFLEQKNLVSYPRLKSHKSYELYIKYFKYNPGCIWLFQPTTKTKKELLQILKKECEEVKSIDFLTSYGGKRSRIDPYPRMSTENNTPGVWLRIALGYESNLEEVKSEMIHILNKLQ